MCHLFRVLIYNKKRMIFELLSICFCLFFYVHVPLNFLYTGSGVVYNIFLEILVAFNYCYQ